MSKGSRIIQIVSRETNKESILWLICHWVIKMVEMVRLRQSLVEELTETSGLLVLFTGRHNQWPEFRECRHIELTLKFPNGLI